MAVRVLTLKLLEGEYEVLEKFKGKALEGKAYVPLFTYFAKMKERGAFKVLCDNYVTTDSGTGVVHQAPYFGEDDNRVCLSYGIISKDMPPICPVDASGCFTDEVTHFKGEYVKDADKNIIKHLKEEGRMIMQGTHNHSYPFCWRSDTPLIYRAVPSWFIRVEDFKESLIKNNNDTYWVPEFARTKRFGNWLENARDWAVSRNRYWGTPIPLWVSDDLEEIVCIGSIEELEKLTGAKIAGPNADLHRENIDHLTIPSSRPGQPPLKRVSEVFDCWFESGSMPYAQSHYPFENRKQFDEGFPADFIAEGIDQTRGWFYTLLVMSTHLFGKPPFKNLIANGIVLASDGEKMSKRKKNYPDPSLVVNKYGADALRLYLINSPVVRGENLKFREEGVKDILKDVLLPFYNAYRFLVQNIQLFEKESGRKFSAKLEKSENIMDRWILSFTNSLVASVREEMAAYRLYNVVPPLVRYVGTLTNWYIRMNRKRLKGEFGLEDANLALETLFHVLYIMVRVLAPFTPFITDRMWQNLKKVLGDIGTGPSDSVHFLMMPTVEEDMIDTEVEARVSAMQTVIDVSRVIRERNTLPLKTPLKELVVIHKDQDYLDKLRSMESYILEETNVRSLTTSTDKTKWGVRLKADADFRNLGVRLKNDLKPVLAAVKALSQEELSKYQKEGNITLCGHHLTGTDLKVGYEIDGTAVSSNYKADSDDQTIVLVDVSPDSSMVEEGLAREICNRVQKLRKKAKLSPDDAVTIYCTVVPETSDLGGALKNRRDLVESTVKQPVVVGKACGKAGPMLIRESQKVKDAELTVEIEDRREGAEVVILNGSHAEPAAVKAPRRMWDQKIVEKLAKELAHVKVMPCNKKMEPKGPVTLLLEHPKKGENRLDYPNLLKEVKAVWSLWDNPRVSLSFDQFGQQALHAQTDMSALDGKVLYLQL